MQAAIARVAQYWKNRRKIFGPRRAFLPMTLDGAMEENVANLEKGFLNCLPPDLAGRQVIFFDRIRATPFVASRDSVLGVLFYILQKALSRDDTAILDKGFVFIENLSGSYDLYTHFDRLLTKTQMILLRCFPAELKAFHIIAKNCGSWAMELIMPVIKQLAGKHIRLRMVCHSNYESVDTFCNTYNMCSNDMSVIVGGNFSYADHLSWLDDEYVRENQEEIQREESMNSSSSTLSGGSKELLITTPIRRKERSPSKTAMQSDSTFCSGRKFSMSNVPRAA
jgi:hypothetical protein